MFLSGNDDFVGPPSMLMNQPASDTAWYDSIKWDSLISTGIKAWSATEAVKAQSQAQAQIAKAQATSPYRTVQYPALTAQRGAAFPVLQGETYPQQRDNMILYLGVSAAALVALFLVMK